MNLPDKMEATWVCDVCGDEERYETLNNPNNEYPRFKYSDVEVMTQSVQLGDGVDRKACVNCRLEILKFVLPLFFKNTGDVADKED